MFSTTANVAAESKVRSARFHYANWATLYSETDGQRIDSQVHVISVCNLRGKLVSWNLSQRADTGHRKIFCAPFHLPRWLCRGGSHSARFRKASRQGCRSRDCAFTNAMFLRLSTHGSIPSSPHCPPLPSATIALNASRISPRHGTKIRLWARLNEFIEQVFVCRVDHHSRYADAHRFVSLRQEREGRLHA